MKDKTIIALLRGRGVELDSSISIIGILENTEEEISIAYDGRIDIKKVAGSSHRARDKKGLRENLDEVLTARDAVNAAGKKLIENLIDDALIGGVDDDDLERLPPNLRSAQMNNQEAHEHWSKEELMEAIYHLTFALQGIIFHLEEK